MFPRIFEVGLMESTEEKAGRAPLSIILVSLLLSVSSALEFWGFYLVGFRMLTLLALGAVGLISALGLLRRRSWGLWLFYALYLPQVVQASTLLWSIVLLWGFQLGSYIGILEIGLIVYLTLLTLSLPLLWRERGAVK